MSKLAFPTNVLDQHAAVLGKTGSGKSSAMRHVVEYLLTKGKRVCVIDPKGDWWGLKAPGTGPGFPVVTFGDFKNEVEGDVPINEHSGAAVAELITSGNRPAVIGFRGWFTAHMLKFWIDFAKGVFHGNEGELFLVIDEAQNFAPKGSTRALEGEAGLALHWTNRLLAEGRGLGINIWVGSQRPQKVHNDTLDGCETLVAMRSVHPAARKSIKEWLDGAADTEKSALVLGSIGSMPRGEAIMWSPEIEFGPQRVAFPMFQTFDSFAPPQLQKKVNRKTWADVDLGVVKEKLAAVIKDKESKDPKALQKRVRDLEGQLIRAELLARKHQNPPAHIKIEPKEVPVFRPGEFEKIEKLESRMTKLGREYQESAKVFWEGVLGLNKTLNTAGAAALHPNNRGKVMAPVPSSRSPSRGLDLKSPANQNIIRRANQSGKTATAGKVDEARMLGGADFAAPGTSSEAVSGLAPRHQDIVNAIAFYNSIGIERCDKKMVAGFVVRPFNGNFRSDLAVLRTAGAVDYPTPGDVVLTDLGRQVVTELPNIATQKDLHTLWLKRLAPRHADILRNLLERDRSSGARDKTEVAEAVGREFNGNFRSDLSVLRTLGVIDYPNPGTVAVSENLFPPIPE